MFVGPGVQIQARKARHLLRPARLIMISVGPTRPARSANNLAMSSENQLTMLSDSCRRTFCISSELIYDSNANSLTLVFLFPALTAAASVQEKAEAAIPITAMSPPEGNTTFLGGTTWCVARPGVPQAELQIALDWACGLGMADCKPIRDGGACFEPDTLVSHASYAFNNYYQQNGNSDIACSFGGTAALTKTDPSTYKLTHHFLPY